MSSSRSDVVTKCVRSSLFFLLVSFKFSLVLKSFNGVSRMFKGCLKFKVSRIFQGSFKGDDRKFWGCFTDVQRVFQWSFKRVWKKFQWRKFQGCSSKIEEHFSFKGDSRVSEVQHVCQGSSNGVSRKFPRSFKEVSRVLQECFKGIWRKFQGCFKADWRAFVRSFQWVSRVVKRNSKGISMKFQMCFNSVSRKFQGCSKKSFRMFHGRLKGV